ncbi:MAG TPA: hypothetical protein VEK57_18800 [Thermoanaerobaculia bacterium]|nr:hypothetical protein [Thermoanaerobaculia bacterium]
MSRMKILGFALLLVVMATAPAEAAGGALPSILPVSNDTAAAPPQEGTREFFDALMAKKRLEIPGWQFTKTRQSCTAACDEAANSCHNACDLLPPGQRAACHSDCFWENENCYCSCGLTGYCH